MTAFSIRPLLATGVLCMGAMMGFATVAGPITRGLGLADWHAGLIVTASGLLWMFLAPVWGRISDRRGRKPILIIGAGGFALVYLALAVFVNAAIAAPPPVLVGLGALLLTRGLIGAFYAALPPVSAAVIADNLPPKDRGAAMAQLGAASGIGMVGGPLIAGLLAGWGLAFPLYVFAILPAVAALVLWRSLPATAPVASSGAARIRLADPRLRLPVIAAFAASFMVGGAQICIGFMMIDRLGLSLEEGARYAGFTLMGIGISLVATQIVVARRSDIAPIRWLLAGVTIGLLACLAVAFLWNGPALIAAFCVSAAGMGMVFPSFQAIAANSVAPHEQGAVAGVVSGAQGMAMVVGPLVATVLYGWHSALPFITAAAVLSLVLVAARQTGAGSVRQAGKV